MAYKNILVGIDGSKRADRAFETAVDLAKVFSAKLPNAPKNSCRSI